MLRKPVPLYLTRRRLLSAAAGTAVVSACGGGGEEGEDFTSWDTKLLNLLASEDSISFAVAGTTYLSGVRFGTIASRTVREDGYYFPDLEVVVIGASGKTYTYKDVDVGPAFWLVASREDAVGNVVSARLSLAGGVPGKYDSLTGTQTPMSKVMSVTSLVPACDLYARYSAAASLVRQGTVDHITDQSVTLLPQAANEFQLVLRNSLTGNTEFDSGLRPKPADAHFFLGRSAVRATTWALYVVDASFGITTWASV